MEADWSAEIGPGLAIVDAGWPGFVDLRRDPSRVHELSEAARLPALAAALVELNAPDSPLFTSRCDVWIMDPAELDPFEFGAIPSACLRGMAAYIDLLLRAPEAFASFAAHESLARDITAHLRAVRVRDGRVDLVIRAAETGGISGFGVTLYAAGSGPHAEAAEAALTEVLATATAVTMCEAAQPRASSSIG